MSHWKFYDRCPFMESFGGSRPVGPVVGANQLRHVTMGVYFNRAINPPPLGFRTAAYRGSNMFLKDGTVNRSVFQIHGTVCVNGM